MSWTDSLNFDLAWQRIQRDLDDDPYPDLLHYKNYQAHLEEIGASIKAHLSNSGGDKYRPSPFRPLDMPKPNFTLRPVGSMHFRDRLLYQAVCDSLAPHYTPEPSVYSYRLAAANSARMFQPGVDQWKQFEAAVKGLCGQHQYMVETDLTAYFEHIDHYRLARRLDDMFPQVERAILRPIKQTLQTLLKTWSNGQSFGIPQVCYPSSFIGNVYLDEFDKCILRKDYPYLRYVDDIRVFADSLPAARTALAEVAQTLRRMGLYVSSAKTTLSPTSQVLARMDQDSAVMERIDAAFDTRKRSAIERVIPEIESLFRASIARETGFGDRHFRFCIYRYRRLKAFGIGGDIHQPIVEEVLKGMSERPNASDVVALYLSLFPGVTDIVVCILDFLEGEYCIYPWQQMHLLEVLIRTVSLSEPGLAERCRRYARKARRPEAHPLVRAKATILLGKLGDWADRREIRDDFFSQPDSELRRAVLIAVQEMNSEERKYFYQNIQGDGLDLGSTVGYLTSLKQPQYHLFNPPDPEQFVDEEEIDFGDIHYQEIWY